MMDQRETPDPEHNWSTFAMCFVGMFPYIPHSEAPSRCVWKVGDTLDRIASDFLRAESPYREEIERAIRQLCETGETKGVSPEGAYFLGLRGAVLGPYFLSFSVQKGGIKQTIMPFPNLLPMRVMEWFLIDWWNRWGPRQISEIRHVEETLPMD